MTENELKVSKKKRRRKNLKVISFDEEVVPKNVAATMRPPTPNNEVNEPPNKEIVDKTPGQGKKRKGQKPAPPKTTEDTEPKAKKPKRLKTKVPVPDTDGKTEEMRDESGAIGGAPPASKKISIRAQKRLKHEQLLTDKKSKVEVELQQKSLNYLSRWKHCRTEWKFEKLRQIWLLQNMLDEDKVPQEFWGTLVEYFGNAKGRIRDVILKDALKVIEAGGTNEEDVKLHRAKDIMQSLNE